MKLSGRSIAGTLPAITAMILLSAGGLHCRRDFAPMQPTERRRSPEPPVAAGRRSSVRSSFGTSTGPGSITARSIDFGRGYSITDLGAPRGRFSEAYGINNSGEVVGKVSLAGAPVLAFLYRGGTMRAIRKGGEVFSVAYGINDTGQMVGSLDTDKAPGHHAFLHIGGVTTDLGTLGGLHSVAYAINNAGQVVGWAYLTRDVAQHAFLWMKGQMRDLGTLGGSDSEAAGINGAGQVVGKADTYSGDSHAFLYRAGVMNDLGTLGGSNSAARSINVYGQVAGSSDTRRVATHAFLYRNGLMKDLGTLGGRESVGDGINDSGQVVGRATTREVTEGGQPVYHAFLSSGGVMKDLNGLIPSTSGWTLNEARAINNAGQIAGSGLLRGKCRAFLLTPARSVSDRRGRVRRTRTPVSASGARATGAGERLRRPLQERSRRGR
jgi:probable HAF family extracellular repeat protein